jgi:hypothetical protein
MACTKADTIPTHRPLHMHIARQEEQLHRLFKRPLPPPDPARTIGPLWIAPESTGHLLTQVEALIRDISPLGTLRYQVTMPSATWWDRFDEIWTQWLSLAQPELYRNQGFTHAVGQAPVFVASTPNALARIFRRHPQERPWRAHLRALQEAAAAITSGTSPPGYHNRDWPIWTQDRIKHLRRLMNQGALGNGLWVASSQLAGCCRPQVGSKHHSGFPGRHWMGTSFVQTPGGSSLALPVDCTGPPPWRTNFATKNRFGTTGGKWTKFCLRDTTTVLIRTCSPG